MGVVKRRSSIHVSSTLDIVAMMRSKTDLLIFYDVKINQDLLEKQMKSNRLEMTFSWA